MKLKKAFQQEKIADPSCEYIVKTIVISPYVTGILLRNGVWMEPVVRDDSILCEEMHSYIQRNVGLIVERKPQTDPD